MSPAAIILAGGESRRMGAPKALLEYRGETFAARLSRVLGSVCQPVILVVGAHPEIAAPGATIVVNTHWHSGQLSSLQAGLRALPANAPAFFFTPVDCPAFGEATVAALWHAFEQQPAPFTIPRISDRRGHPVLASPEMALEFLALPATAQARDVVHRWRSATNYVDVDDPAIFADIDTPEAYRSLK